MNIYNFIAYDENKDLAKAYNRYVSLLDDDDWFVFVDHDAMFVQTDWWLHLKSVIEKNKEYSLFTCLTNRTGCKWQVPEGVDPQNHDIRYHREISKILRSQNLDVIDVTHVPGKLSGQLMISNKKDWDLVGGARNMRRGLLGTDNDLHYRYAKKGLKVGLIPTLYHYHWYRADGDTSHLK